MRVETMGDARIVSNLWPSVIAKMSETVGSCVGRGLLSQDGTSNNERIRLLSHRIAELAEARVMLLRKQEEEK